ncbi:MAG: Cna B-type domain-containing protein, partial [Bacteroidales bacterium]|nr:Cna B-type domain-containing protein [Bacteroidales bacterium]
SGELWISSGTSVDIDLNITQSDFDTKFHDTTDNKITPIIKTQSEINSYVNGLISAGRSTSSYLASQKTIAPTLDDCRASGTLMSQKGYNGNPCIDTTMFPDSITIYVDCTNIEDVIKGNWNIAKRPNQSIVFNMPGSHVNINEFNVYELDENYNKVTRTMKQHGTAPNPLISTTKMLNSDPNQNQAADEVILEHITFNCYNASNMELHNATALFLVPNGTVDAQENGAGWILAGGCVISPTEWHFYRHERGYKGVKTGMGASKFMNRLGQDNNKTSPSSTQKFDFVLEQLDITDGLWKVIQTVKNNASSITFNELSFTAKDEGEQYFRIRENPSSLANVEYDPTQYIIKAVVSIDPGTSSSSTVTTNIAKTYWKVTDAGMTAENPIESYTTTLFDLSADGKLQSVVNGSPEKAGYRAKNVTLYRVNNTYLTTATDNAGGTGSDSATASTIVFVNTYVGKYCVAITKDWDDEDDRDGVRPDGLIVELWKNDYPLDSNGKPDTTQQKAWQQVTEVMSATQSATDTSDKLDYAILNKAKNWTAMVKGVDKYDAKGELIEYKWIEKAFYFGTPNGFAKVGNEYAGTGSVTVINAETINGSNETNTFKYYITPEGTISKSDGAGYTAVTYTGAVTGVDTKTSEEDGGTITYITMLTNKHEKTTTTVKATKEWKKSDGTTADTPAVGSKQMTFRLIGEYTVDVLNSNGVKTGEDKYEVHNLVRANGDPIGDIVLDGEIDENGEAEPWVATWVNLPLYYDGHKITYKVLEVEAPLGYTSTATETAQACTYDSEHDCWIVTITNTEALGSLEMTKSLFVDGVDKSDDYKDSKTFYVKVKTVIDGVTYWVTSEHGDLAKESDLNDTVKAKVFAINPSAAKKVTIDKLPIGDYTAVEVADSDGTALTASNAPAADMGKMEFQINLSRTEDSDTVTTGGTGSVSLINAYTSGRYCIAVTKQWLVNGEVSVPDKDTKVYVKLQRTTTPDDETSWQNVPNIYMGTAVEGGNIAGETGNNVIVLEKANNWSAVAVGMDQKDANGNRYSYRWVELSDNPNTIIRDNADLTHGVVVGRSYKFGTEADAWYAVGKSTTIQK